MSNDKKESIDKSKLMRNIKQHNSDFKEKVEEARNKRNNKIYKEYKAAGYNEFFEIRKEAEKKQGLAMDKAKSLKDIFHTIVNSILDKKRVSGPGKNVTIKNNIIAKYKKRKNPELSLKQTVHYKHDILGCFNDKDKVKELEELFNDLTDVQDASPKNVKVPIDINSEYECFYGVEKKRWTNENQWSLSCKESKSSIPIKISSNDSDGITETSVYTVNKAFSGGLNTLEEITETKQTKNNVDFIAISTELIEATEKINKEIEQRLEKIEEIQSKWIDNYSTAITVNEL